MDKDYKKLYEEALQRARESYRRSIEQGWTCDKEIYEQIFPELRESKDERIRKEIIAVFKGKISYTSEEDTKKYIAWLEKKSETKSTDKVEPKFKVGDWCIDNEDDTIFQIVKVLDNTYTYKTNDGEEYSCTHYSLENDTRLWTIQDAKDGDVLATKKGNPFIYDKNRYNNGLAYYYAGLDVNKELTLKSPHHMLAHFGELHSVSPATKEQRDLLFQKMKESGYEWDTKKKELKKIEQSCYHNDGLYYAIDILEKTIGKVEGYQSDDGKMEHQIAIETVNALYNKKPSWNEEDEANMDAVWKACGQVYGVKYQGILEDWLKSLKDRVQLQPKQEWSEEDEKIINDAIWLIEHYATDGHKKLLREQTIDKLKSLKPNNWKLSEVKKETKNKCPYYSEGYGCETSPLKQCDTCPDYKLYNHWKPSEEQMEELEYITRGNSYPYLTSLYQDLKNL